MIAVAVVAWITGVFGTTAAGGEQLQVFPNGTLKNATSLTEPKSNWKWALNLTIYNKGASASRITGASVGSASCNVEGDGTIGPGNTSTINFSCTNGGIAVGVTYTVKIYTAAGNVYFTQVVAAEERKGQ